MQSFGREFSLSAVVDGMLLKERMQKITKQTPQRIYNRDIYKKVKTINSE
ncbi:MAG TPA: hypothetical protein PKD85_14405 [Saprospiraceae bacterium]|nr:hypothetical protein [Saprospiraceae bacterium]